MQISAFSKSRRKYTLGVGAAKGIAEALKKHPEFKKALLKDLFTGRLQTEIPQALDCIGSGIIAAGAQLAVLDCSDNAGSSDKILEFRTYLKVLLKQIFHCIIINVSV